MPAKDYQEVELPVDEDTARVRVRALRPDSDGGPRPPRTILPATLTESDFSTAFASAAMARAAKIPAQVAMGLVYYQKAHACHMWTEVQIDGRWIPLDGTLGKGGIGAAHLKVAHSNLKSASPYAGFLPVLKIIGRLEIEIEEKE